MILIKARQVEKYYVLGDPSTRALKGVSFEIHSGEMVALLGLNGSGKTTLLSIIGALMKPTSGQILFDNRDIFTFSENQLSIFRNRNIGFIFQFHHLLQEFTVLENVYFPAAGAKGFISDEIVENAKGLLRQVGLESFTLKKANDLSGGQKQRVAIARAFINKPKLLLADEPTGNLDREAALNVMELILNMNKRLGLTAIISTHNPEIADYCSSKIEMLNGNIANQTTRGNS